MSVRKKRINSLIGKLLSLGLLLLTACASRHDRPASVRDQVRILDRVPVGVSCQNLGPVRSRDGAGCANLGHNYIGQKKTLLYNLQQQARGRGANVLILNDEGIHTESFAGCPNFGLVAEAELYRCDFSLSGR